MLHLGRPVRELLRGWWQALVLSVGIFWAVYMLSVAWNLEAKAVGR